ncbi:MAG: M24 family metallopeptidase [Planctomycetes bacterium]|nr:M24 family metallopeptidase [Planctomycetota bacterium]
MESWPVTGDLREIETAEVATNLESARRLMREQGADALVVTSADRYLNEYTPREDNHRFDLSGFTGSTALLLVPIAGPARLYVDGRYHLQADVEVDAALVTVVKVPFGTTITDALLDDLAGCRRPAFEGERVSEALARKLRERAPEAIQLADGLLRAALDRPIHLPRKPITPIPAGISGLDLADKLAAVFARVTEAEESILLITALDDIAWLSDLRGYHFEYQSSFAARALATASTLYLIVEPDQLVDLPAALPTGLEVVAGGLTEALRRPELGDRRRLHLDPAQVTASLVAEARAARPDLLVVEGASPVVAVKARKNAAELAHMEAANDRSARAIARTVRWVRERFRNAEPVTEAAFYEAANGFYAAEGARDLSFHTIAAVGANSAVIHFSDPSDQVVAGADDLMLLDSGALYEGGYATDVTRAFIAGGALAQPSERQRKLYTTVLRGLLRGMMAVFPEGTRGAFLDALVRAPLYEQGLDYAHGTGHGVGIHVHEPGVGISPGVTAPILAGHVCSIEPGVYIEGFGGIRHENVVVFERHPDHENSLRSRPLDYVGFDVHLVDESLFDARELACYRAYMAECARRGTTLD